MILKKSAFLLFLVIFSILYSQNSVLEKYPYGQDYYAGGYKGMTMEIIEVLKSKKLSPCENNQERYLMPILVNADGSINYVKVDDTLTISQNKCAYNLGRKIFPHMKRWIPAKLNNHNVGAITNILIDPFFLFNSKDNPDENVYTQPKFKNGAYKFSSEVKRIFERSIRENEDKKSAIVFFVNEKGKTVDFSVEGNYSENEKKNLITSLSKINVQIDPGTFNSIPVKIKMRLSLRQVFSIDLEKERIENEFKALDFKFR